MRRTLLGPGLLALAVVLYSGAVRPLRAKAEAAAHELRRTWDQRSALLQQLAVLEKRNDARRRAASFSVNEPGGMVRAVRRSVVQSLDGSSLRGVRLGVRPEGARAVATVRLSAEGGFDEIMRLSGHVVRPGSGLVLNRARFGARSGDVGMELEALGLEER